MRTLVELAPLRLRRGASWGSRRSGGFAKHFYLLGFPRWHPASFSERPAKLLTYRPAHGGNGEPHTPPLLPQLVLELEGSLLVLLKPALTVTVACKATSERTQNNRNKALTIKKVGSIYRPNSYEPFRARWRRRRLRRDG
jgi:hypothetical protein